jgi:hypothetical protein
VAQWTDPRFGLTYWIPSSPQNGGDEESSPPSPRLLRLPRPEFFDREVSLGLCHPASPAYGLINRAVLRKVWIGVWGGGVGRVQRGLSARMHAWSSYCGGRAAGRHQTRRAEWAEMHRLGVSYLRPLHTHNTHSRPSHRHTRVQEALGPSDAVDLALRLLSSGSVQSGRQEQAWAPAARGAVRRGNRL